jgi:poly-gamma-glutamate synthesis protein (capsule biosynthesis protein)
VLIADGPPEGAAALSRARFTVVSTANNHAWDYGKPALLETIDLLDAAGVAHAGTGRDRDEARRPAIVESGRVRLAVLAVTDIWNDGELVRHPADAHVARAEAETLAEAVRAARAGGADAVVVSYHGGVEYGDTPLPRAREILHAAIDAGADAVLGHHPHVVQGVEWYRSRPIFYSMGNLLMRMHRDHPWTELAFMARLSVSPGGGATLAAVCPFRILGLEQRPLANDARREEVERWFYDHLSAVSKPLGGLKIDAPGADGCAVVHPS